LGHISNPPNYHTYEIERDRKGCSGAIGALIGPSNTARRDPS
jgi:hypothetical protein